MERHPKPAAAAPDYDEERFDLPVSIDAAALSGEDDRFGLGPRLEPGDDERPGLIMRAEPGLLAPSQSPPPPPPPLPGAVGGRRRDEVEPERAELGVAAG